MDSKIVNKAIRQIIKPYLKEFGFSVFTARNNWRYRNDRIEIINFESFNSYTADVLGCSTFSISVNLGTYITYIPTIYEHKYKNDKMIPAEYHCHFRGGLYKSIKQDELKNEVVWYIDEEGNNLSDVIQDIIKQIEDNALPWFDRLLSDKEIYNILLNEKENMRKLYGFGNNPSPNRSLLKGLVAKKLNKNNEGNIELKNAINSGCFDALKENIEQIIIGTL